MDTVAVLLSSFNGEKYISQQIESIFNQKDVHVELFIRDDGSSDDTLKIIRQNKKIHLLEGQNVGVGNSFMQLVYNVGCKYDYYAFSDQDDIWLPEKLIKAINAIRNYKAPTLYCSNQKLIDADGNETGMRFNRNPDLSYEGILSGNKVSGCTMVWNTLLHEIISKNHPSEHLLHIRIHDVWVVIVACICGNVIYDKNGYILYRQHENNVVGAKEITKIDILKQQIKRLNNPKLRNPRSSLAEELVELFPKETDGKKMILLASDSKSLKGKIRLMKNSKYFTYYTGETVRGFAFRVIFNFF